MRRTKFTPRARASRSRVHLATAPALSCADSLRLQALWRVFGDSGDSRKGLPLEAVYSAFFHFGAYRMKKPASDNSYYVQLIENKPLILI